MAEGDLNMLVVEGEDPTMIRTHIDHLREWIQQQRPVVNSLVTDEFLLRFLRVTNFCLEHAKEWLVNFWRYRCESPVWFKDRNLLTNPIMVEIAKTAYCLQLPKETANKYLIFAMRIGHFDGTKYTLDDVTKYAFAVTDIINAQPAAQLYGFVILLDFSEVRLQHVSQFTPDRAHRYVDCWEKMYPAHLRQIHFYNYPSLFDPILYLFRMFFGRKLNERIFFHSSAQNLSLTEKSLHQFITPNLLPIEYGGELGSIEGEMNDKFVIWTQEHNDCMINLEHYGVDVKEVSKLLKTFKKKDEDK